MEHSHLQIIYTPILVVGLLALTLFVGATSESASASPVEVLYVAQLQASKASLATYNVNPVTAVAVQVEPTITVEGSSVSPLSIGTKHVIYVWNATDVWV
jgi:hypothetical protein